MTIPEAIENLDNLYTRGYKLTTKEHYAAIKFGMVALERIDLARRSRDVRIIDYLPGETP